MVMSLRLRRLILIHVMADIAINDNEETPALVNLQADWLGIPVTRKKEIGRRKGWSVASTHAKAALKLSSRNAGGVVTLLTWNHACTVNVKGMDQQHAILMDTLNDIRLALVHGQGREQVSDALNRLIEFTRMHFASEEQLLKSEGFPGVFEHRDVHRKLLGQIEEAALRIQHSDDARTKSMLLLLRDWYMTHIEGLDSQYGVWLNARGIS
jgi:hemerythrin